MEYQVKVTILDHGFVVEDKDFKEACNDSKSLFECLDRIKKLADKEPDLEDE